MDQPVLEQTEINLKNIGRSACYLAIRYRTA